MQTAICTSDFDGLSGEAYIPVEFLYCDPSQQSHSQDALSIVELGKQLLQSAGDGDTEVVRDLMCRGAPFTTDNYGTSALHCAAQNNHLETAEVLLRAGISRDAKTKVDRTPLHLAAYEGHHQMAQLLLTYGAEVDSKDMLKMTPLHWAVEQEHVEVMLILLEHGADTNATSKFDKTPMSLALEHDRLDLVDLLQQERKLVNIREPQCQPVLSQAVEITEASSGLMTVASTRSEPNQQFEIAPTPFLQPKRKNYVQYPPSKKTKPVCQQLDIHGPSDDEQEKDTELAERISTIENSTLKKRKDIGEFDNLDQPLRLLQAHGITMIPVDNDASIVENAMESGRTVVLTEAGKLALNLTRQGPMGVKRIQVGSRKGVPRKVIAIRADKLLGHTAPNLASRGPNILKRNSSTVENKSRKLYFASLSNNTITTPRPTVISTQKKIVTPVPEPKVPDLLHLANDIEEILEDDSSEGNSEPVMDIATLNKQLIEARRLAAEYRKQLQIKEEEAEIYKQQLRNITAQKTTK